MIAIPFAIGYAVVTYRQWRDLHQNFEIDERAWLYVSRSVLPKEPSEEDRHIQINTFVVNSGKTPAVAVGLKSGIFLFDHDPPMVDWKQIQLEPQGVLFPGQINGSFVRETQLYGAPDVAIYKAKKARIYLRTCLVYTDTFNKPHFTESCVYHIFGQAPDEWIGCNGNTVDEPQTVDTAPKNLRVDDELNRYAVRRDRTYRPDLRVSTPSSRKYATTGNSHAPHDGSRPLISGMPGNRKQSRRAYSRRR